MSNQPPTPPGEPDFGGGGSTPPPSAPQPPPSAPPGQPPASPPPAPPGGGGGGGFGTPTGGGGQYSIGEAFNYGWTKFQANLGQILLGALVLFVAGAIIVGIWYAIAAAVISVGDSDAGFFALLMFTALFSIVGAAAQYVIQAQITRGALAITYGRKIDMQTMLSLDNIGQVLIGGLLLGIATAIGFALCYIPGLIVAFFGQFFVHFAVDKSLPAMDAIRASVQFVNQNIGTLIGFYIASIVAIMVGFLLCGIGALVAIPVVVIAQAYTFRTLQGEAVAA